MGLAREKPVPAAIAQDTPLSPENFRRIARVLHEDAGIAMPDAKRQLAHSRLSKRLRRLGMDDFTAYCDLVESKGGAEERGHMLAALTTNVTRFFREPHHFELLEKSVLPPLLDRARRGGRVRLWSAGCSTGEEPYSLALTILSMLPNAADLDIRILATDIDPNVLATARRGLYTARSAETIPERSRKRYVENTDDPGQVRMGDTVRRLVTLNGLNLVRRWPMKGPFDVIFCRNVVIYFDEATQRALWQEFARVLAPDGWLLIGHSERVFGPAAQTLRTAGITAYRKTVR